ncbi:MAG: SHOCT domain-containing protein [Propionibacteriaceae bacterium]
MRHYVPDHSVGLLPYLIHGVFSLIFLALVVILVIVLLKKLRNGQLHMPTFVGMAPNPESDPYLSALKILNERLANGDIDVDEYYARRTALKGPDPSAQA